MDSLVFKRFGEFVTAVNRVADALERHAYAAERTASVSEEMFRLQAESLAVQRQLASTSETLEEALAAQFVENSRGR